MYKQYKVEIDPNDKENPCVPLILTKETKNNLENRTIKVTQTEMQRSCK